MDTATPLLRDRRPLYTLVEYLAAMCSNEAIPCELAPGGKLANEIADALLLPARSLDVACSQLADRLIGYSGVAGPRQFVCDGHWGRFVSLELVDDGRDSATAGPIQELATRQAGSFRWRYPHEWWLPIALACERTFAGEDEDGGAVTLAPGTTARIVDLEDVGRTGDADRVVIEIVAGPARGRRLAIAWRDLRYWIAPFNFTGL